MRKYNGYEERGKTIKLLSMGTIKLPRSPYDEVGTPDDKLERCKKHDVIYRVGQKCLCCEREHNE